MHAHAGSGLCHMCILLDAALHMLGEGALPCTPMHAHTHAKEMRVCLCPLDMLHMSCRCRACAFL